GHVTRDLTPEGSTVGGTVTFSTLTARALGRSPAVITSAELDFDLSRALSGIPVEIIPSAATTTFENIYTPHGRIQMLHSVAGPIGKETVPETWRNPQILHLGPLIQEVDPNIIRQVSSELVGLTPQGWHRSRNSNGQVQFVHWSAVQEVLPLATAVIVSYEDILDEETWSIYRNTSKLLVITNGAAGCEVFFKGERRHFPPPQVKEIDPTGVGDIFAAAFFIHLWETGGDPWEAARFATMIAAPSVTRRGLNGIPTLEEINIARQG
ncbi:MAG: hypothetical protein JXA42_10275, partial [Anaerolineales bacterium]|nr:hypothetical protein [Anaerolineales bacterium]